MPFRLPTSDLPDNQWQKPLFLTVAVHICFVLFGLFAPRFMHFQQEIPEVYTVNLFSVEDLGGPVEEPQQQEDSGVPEPVKPTPLQKAQPAPEPPAVAKDVISLKPIKTKEKADIDKVKMLRDKLLQEKADVAKVKALREKLLAEAHEKQVKAAAEKARADADQKAKGAVDSLKNALKAGQQLAAGRAAASASSAAQAGNGSGSGPSGGITVDENLRRYLIALSSQIQEHWVLPEMQSWKENIEADVIIRVRRDGTVVESTFKKRSDNIYFNQFVEKALKLSSPLPPFPVGINQSEMEIGLKFKPGEVF